ncbi:ureidoglycolate lyase [Phyllobacterium sp. 22229]|uniref:Ureidoglycolate lyase n=1 Tax=Phyllobacterium myrsinacearum TaxID=28101 RepID=A0A2S9JFB7_9HYPH|nr:ureidoglycolate lyase [Phyllobacterium myrsinacearum]PRD51617.1 Ureidoglycolate hydrolase [Phyllobacterium myrsinacearum]PWV89522.1 ureidoglycolate lyase [Phyllobacterium myrsinacearum]RZS79210.1 ureidoglycolate lyase [Phyllobacterium myrsinacearum]RZU99887.1 ureidoglycolate lyase [Phyllobacterium myrsinacearum]
MRDILIQPLSRDAFRPFGDVIEVEGSSSFPINHGMCTRYHDLAKVETTGENPRVLISLLRGKPYDLPLTLAMVERHPLGSQAFMPLSAHPFLVVVAHDRPGGAGDPIAFLTAPGQGVNIHRNIWHGILTPLGGTSDFVVVDRGGDGNNLEEYFYPEPFIVR